MPNGILQVYATISGQAAPLAGAQVLVYSDTGASIATLTTDANGAAQELSLPAPDKRYSLEEANTTVLPYAVYDLVATAPGWQPIEMLGVQVFDGQVTNARLEFLPESRALPRTREAVVIPEHVLFRGGGGSGPAPAAACPQARVLTEVVVPKKITVHLGRPTANVSNVSVSFQDYIANVASSEVYPTWAGHCLAHAIKKSVLRGFCAARGVRRPAAHTPWFPFFGRAAPQPPRIFQPSARSRVCTKLR